MCEFNTKITIAQLLSLTIVSAKSKTYSPRWGYLSPGNSIVLQIAATLLFIGITIFADFGAHCVETQAHFQQPCLFSWTLPAYRAIPQKSSRIRFQPRYATLLSSKITQITQHDIKVHKGCKYLGKILFQRKINWNKQHIYY